MTSHAKLILSALGVVLLATPASAAPPQYYGPEAANYVVADGTVIGADPDLQIRSQLLREWGSLHGE